MTGNGVTEDLCAAWRPQVLGTLVRRYGQFAVAEDATQEALLQAAEEWRRSGVPDNPRAWLITVASRRMTDLLRAELARRRREETAAAWTFPLAETAPADDAAAGRPGRQPGPALPLLPPRRWPRPRRSPSPSGRSAG